jgi:hypothetical protein
MAHLTRLTREMTLFTLSLPRFNRAERCRAQAEDDTAGLKDHSISSRKEVNRSRLNALTEKKTGINYNPHQMLACSVINS